MQRIAKLFLVTTLLLVPIMLFAFGGREEAAGQGEAETTTTETATDTSTQTAQAQGALPENMKRASELVDTRIEVNANVQATVKDMVAEWQGSIPYAVVSFSGISGIEDRLYPVPVGMLNLGQAVRNGETLRLSVALSESDIQGAPFLENGQLPDTSSTNWDETWRTYWQTISTNEDQEAVGQVASGDTTPDATTGSAPAADPWGQRQAVLVNQQLIGFDVVNRTDQPLGKVEDVVIDFAVVGQPTVAYLALSGGDTATLGAGATLFAIPFDVFTLNVDKKEITLDTESTQLSGGFTQDAWPTTAPSAADVLGAGTSSTTDESGAATESDSTTEDTEGSASETEGSTSDSDSTTDSTGSTTDSGTTGNSGSTTNTGSTGSTGSSSGS